jgi:hypothetical protein
MRTQLSVLCSTGNLGDTPIEEASFYNGIKRNIDYLGADAGSSDLGPTFLGADVAHNPVDWEKHDIELLLLAARERNIPLIIGSCGSTGTNRGVNLFIELIKEVALKFRLKKFKLAAIYSELDKALLKERMVREPILPLEADLALTTEDISSSDHITAAMGVEQLVYALQNEADVILAGRCCDDAVFAAYPIFKGFPRGLSLHLGKAIECASLVAYPQRIKESVLGTITSDFVLLEPIHPDQRITPHSVAAHSMYERKDPYFQEVPGGVLDMQQTKYEACGERICKISGSKYILSHDGSYRIKLEAAGCVGYRVFHFVGIRDTIAIKYIKKILQDTTEKVQEIYCHKQYGKDYQLYFHVYGVDGVMKEFEPVKDIYSHELGILIEVVSQDIGLAEAVAKLAKFRFFYAQYPGQRNSSGGGAAIVIDEPLFPKNKAYRWTMSHLLRLDDPLDPEIFKYKFIEVGV